MIKVFKRAVKLILYRKGSEEDWQESSQVIETLCSVMRAGGEEWKQANSLLKDLRKLQEKSLSC